VTNNISELKIGDIMNWKKAFDICTDSQYSEKLSVFNKACFILWQYMEAKATPMAAGYSVHVDPAVVTSTILRRLLKRREKPFQLIAAKASYISMAIRHCCDDQYNSEIKHQSPVSGQGRKRVLSLDFSLENGRQLHELIAAPEETEEGTNIPIFDQLELKLETRLYEEEIHQVPHKTNKGRQTFLTEAKRFRDYRDRKYFPQARHYKKFDRQREIMKDYLSIIKQKSLNVPEVSELINVYYQNAAVIDLFQSFANQMDSEKHERLIIYRISSIALYQYEQTYGIDESDKIYLGLLRNCLHDFFAHQMYRTKRTSRKKSK
jgi:hypothetical protein